MVDGGAAGFGQGSSSQWCHGSRSPAKVGGGAHLRLAGPVASAEQGLRIPPDDLRGVIHLAVI